MACCRTGWAYPWAVRIRLCDLMLRGMFDTLDEASYVESKDALLQLLQTRVWPLLGISHHIHNTIYAWIHFRQFAVTGEASTAHASAHPPHPKPLVSWQTLGSKAPHATRVKLETSTVKLEAWSQHTHGVKSGMQDVSSVGLSYVTIIPQFRPP